MQARNIFATGRGFAISPVCGEGGEGGEGAARSGLDRMRGDKKKPKPSRAAKSVIREPPVGSALDAWPAEASDGRAAANRPGP